MLPFLFFLAVQPDLDKLAAAAQGTVGAAAVHLETGHRVVLRGGERFTLQSVFKVPIAIEVLTQVDAGRLALDKKVDLTEADRRAGPRPSLSERIPTSVTVGELVEAMLEASDNTACDKLLALVGGPSAVETRMRALGLKEITIRYSEKELREGKDNTATPEEMARLLEKLARAELGLSKASADLLDAGMAKAFTGPNRIRAGVPAGTVVRHKTGGSGTRRGVTETTNDIGVIDLPDGGHLVMVVFVHDSRVDEKTRDKAIADIARAAWEWAVADR